MRRTTYFKLSMSILTIFLMALSTLGTQAQSKRPFAIGASATFGSGERFGGELYLRLKKPDRLFSLPAELRAGFTMRSREMHFDGVTALDGFSFGPFGDLAIYPFGQSGLFTGLRWEVLSMNLLASESVAKIEQQRGYTVPSFFPGSCLFLQLGYRLQASDGFALRLYGQPGIRYTFANNGSTSMNGGSMQVDLNRNSVMEHQFNFIYNVHLGIEIGL